MKPAYPDSSTLYGGSLHTVREEGEKHDDLSLFFPFVLNSIPSFFSSQAHRFTRPRHNYLEQTNHLLNCIIVLRSPNCPLMLLENMCKINEMQASGTPCERAINEYIYRSTLAFTVNVVEMKFRSKFGLLRGAAVFECSYSHPELSIQTLAIRALHYLQ